MQESTAESCLAHSGLLPACRHGSLPTTELAPFLSLRPEQSAVPSEHSHISVSEVCIVRDERQSP